MKKVMLGACALLMGVSLSVMADVKLAAPFGDSMVLQREKPVAVWGTADPGEGVTVSFAGKQVSAKADAAGAWKVHLPAMPASTENRVLTVQGKNTITVKNVLVGEVWLCSGQSNMELPLWGGNPRFRDRQGAMVAQVTYRPLIRFANVSTYTWKVKPQTNPARPIVWHEVNPKTLVSSGFSATGFYYAMELFHALGVPVGMIDAHWGGTNIDAWTPREGTASRPDLKDILDYPVTEKFTKEMRKGPVSGPQQQPAVLFNAMIAPVVPYTLRGAIWYQGCHNAGEPQRYCSKMHALYNGWAKVFENPDFKLYFAQLAPWGNSNIAMIQQAQAQFALEEKNTGMAVINDIGNLFDIHPNEKEMVAKRLALHAFKDLYGFKDIVADSPTLASYEIQGDAFVMSFNNATGWYVYNMNRSLDTGFEIAGADGKFVPAKIKKISKSGVVTGAKLEVYADGVKEPKQLRYLYSRPWFGGLYNQVCLPLGAFHIDAK